MVRVIFTFVFALFVSASAWAGNWNNQNYKQGVNKGYRFKDTDWSHTFYASAGFPINSEDRWNARWLEEGKTKFLRFRLFNGQIGTSLSDNKNRHGAAFWERAEVKAGREHMTADRQTLKAYVKSEVES